MNDDRHQPQSKINELEAFEQQLRSMTPRAAAFQLSEVKARDLQVAASPAVVARSPRTRAWVATLIAAWSMGAAAGISGTLLYSRLGTATIRPATAAVSLEPGIPIDKSAQADGVRDKTSTTRVDANELVTPVKSAAREDLQPAGTSANSYLFTPWGFLSEATSRSPRAREILTPRSFAADLAFDTPRMGNLRLGGAPRELENQNATTPESPAVIVTLPTDKLELPPPINQRDLLRNFLQI